MVIRVLSGPVLMDNVSKIEFHRLEGEILSALTDAFEEHYDRIVRYVAGRIGNWNDAEDIVSETFTKALNNAKKFERRASSITSWLYKIATNLIVDYYRGNARKKQVPLEELIDLKNRTNVEREVENQIALQEILQIMKGLTPSQHEVLMLRLIGGLSSKETARVMGKNDGAVRELQRVALNNVRDMIARRMHISGKQSEVTGDGR